jgi:hypothetical protein
MTQSDESDTAPGRLAGFLRIVTLLAKSIRI